MRKNQVVTSIIGVALLFVSLPALANANMSFSNAGPYNYNGESSYPYYLTVNGAPLQAMMCLGFNEHISGGETWQATVASVGSLDLSTHLLDYQAAFLFQMALKDGGANSDVNAAVWYLFEGVPALDTGASSLVALAQSQSYYQGEFPSIILYTAIPGTESGTLGTAQNFFGTPEPGTLLLLGTGIVGFGSALRRRLGI